VRQLTVGLLQSAKKRAYLADDVSRM